MIAISARIAEQLGARQAQVQAAIELLDSGASVPFIARYRKEVTGGLDDTQMRVLEERLRYLRELEERRASILKSISEQGKLTPELTAEIDAAETKNRLEDLYLPYKPRRRTKGQIALEAGLLPLAEDLLANPGLQPEQEALRFIAGSECNDGSDAALKITDTRAALDGAKYILMERFSENAALLGRLRDFLYNEGILSARLIGGKQQEGARFQDYFEYDEPLKTVPSHRALAVFRGRNEGVLSVSITLAAESGSAASHPCEAMLADFWEIRDQGRAADKWLAEVVRWAWRVRLLPHLETDLLGALRERAEAEAINVFASNLKDLLLAAPAGQKATIGLDPGLRTGCKLAVVDVTGKVLDYATIYPTPPRSQVAAAEQVLVALCRKHPVSLIAIGNGTGSRETDQFVGDVLKRHADIGAQKVMVNEAGASVYSASELAAREFPDLDVTIRGAISIARRLQDPLAELVKIDPKSIGVGQYQHDVAQSQLARSLDAVVEDCVNAVGVEVNTASVPLLAAVSGLNQSIASSIVAYRDQHGAFADRQSLKKVPRLGARTFEQAAGFLRIAKGDNPLDASAVHPEAYGVVRRIAEKNGRPVAGLIGDSAFLCSLRAADFVDEKFGIPTITDILLELDKPGRDPRPGFKTARFQEGVETITDLVDGMVLEGTVTNVTNFGAFVDVGVHQDGLVHISALSNSFVRDPREVVRTGDIVNVKVMEVDVGRKRIALSMRLDDQPGGKSSTQTGRDQIRKPGRGGGKPQGGKKRESKVAANGTMAALFAEASQKNNGRL